MILTNYYIDSIESIKVYDSDGNLISELQSNMQTYEIKSIKLARYLINCGHELANDLNSPVCTPLTFYDSQSLRDDIKTYESMSNIVSTLSSKIDILLEAEKNYPEDLNDLDDYLCLVCSINKLIKLKAIILASLECEKDVMSIAKKEKYLAPVITSYSDTSIDITDSMIKYIIRYSKRPAEYTSYNNAMFEYFRKD